MSKIFVIIPAAGSSSRFGGDRSKIFMPLKGRAVLLRTLDIFASRADVEKILVAVSAADLAEVSERFGAELKAMGAEILVGGKTRTDSVRNALELLDDTASLVCVHDAARPCLKGEWIDAVFAKAGRTGAAILACPVHGTTKKVNAENIIESTVDRTGLWQAQTPQVFSMEIIRRAYAQGQRATDDAHLVQEAGYEVSVVPCDPRNIKITTPADFAFAEAVLDTL